MYAQRHLRATLVRHVRERGLPFWSYVRCGVQFLLPPQYLRGGGAYDISVAAKWYPRIWLKQRSRGTTSTWLHCT